jgi:hypothetical protein
MIHLKLLEKQEQANPKVFVEMEDVGRNLISVDL